MSSTHLTAGRSPNRHAVPICLLSFTLLASPAVAGPPLLCHPFDIGSARSLPWDGSSSWHQGQAGYKLSNLVADTEALLTRDTPVIVRMETLRRASIYASADAHVAGQLLGRLAARVDEADRTGRPDPLALLDAAYVIEALRQITHVDYVKQFEGRAAALRELVAGKDGYAMVKKGVDLRPGDASFEFAAALMAAGKDRAAYAAHAKKARSGAPRDALLARNIHQLG